MQQTLESVPICRVYLFAVGTYVRLFVCMNATISATIRVRNIQFGMKVAVYHKQIRFSLNLMSH